MGIFSLFFFLLFDILAPIVVASSTGCGGVEAERRSLVSAGLPWKWQVGAPQFSTTHVPVAVAGVKTRLCTLPCRARETSEPRPRVCRHHSTIQATLPLSPSLLVSRLTPKPADTTLEYIHSCAVPTTRYPINNNIDQRSPVTPRQSNLRARLHHIPRWNHTIHTLTRHVHAPMAW